MSAEVVVHAEVNNPDRRVPPAEVCRHRRLDTLLHEEPAEAIRRKLYVVEVDPSHRIC